MLTVERFVTDQRALLTLEKDVETEQSRSLFDGQSGNDLEKQGVCITKLYPAGVATGLYGRRIVTLTRDDLPNHSLSPGDIAGVAHKDLSIINEGIVSKVGRDSICVAFDELSDDLLQLNKVTVLKLTNNITYKRYEACLKKLEKCELDMIERLLCEDVKLPPVPAHDIKIDYQDANLNSGQREAVRMCLARSDIAIIHGPPGTGKTTTIVEVVRQLVHRNEKVLVCAPSNIAVDNLLLKLSSSCNVVRVGHPARVNVQLHQYSLDAKLKDRDEDNIIGDVRKDIDKAISECRGHGKRAPGRPGIGDLKKELREREYKATKEVLSAAQVVLTTLASSSRQGPLGKLNTDHFSVCVIDEASQALEVACWMGMLNAKKVILAGDHCQLPPTIKSDKAAKAGLSLTLMERLVGSVQHVYTVCAKLTEQYRMNEAIMSWSSAEMYQNKLTAHTSVAAHLLSDLAPVTPTDLTSTPLCFIDTAGANLHECLVGVSRGNAGEAKIVLEYIEELLECGVEQKNIAVITPYNLQIELIKTEMKGTYKEVEVCTVDGFQGREKEAIIISMVRSNEKGEIGFLSERRRMNVAVTRAKRHVCLVGDSMTVTRDPFLGRLVEYFRAHALVRSAFEYELCGQETIEVHQINTEDESPKEVKTRPGPAKMTSSQEATFKETTFKTLSGFKESDRSDNLTFTGLNSYQRRIIHVLCEELLLFSSSRGSGAERELVVSKAELDSSTPRDHDDKPDDGADIVKDVPHGTKTETSLPAGQCTQCGRVVPPSNMDLHLLHCKRNTGGNVAPDRPKTGEDALLDNLLSAKVCKQCGKRIPAPNMELHLAQNCKPKTFAPTSSSNSKTNKAKQPKNKKKVVKADPPDSEDFSLIEQATQDRLRCFERDCKDKTLSYMQPCQYCSKCYCTAHKFPESHGCGAAARQAAQKPPVRQSVKANEAAKNRLKQQLRDKEKDRTRKAKS